MKRVALLKKVDVASMDAEDFAIRFESGALVVALLLLSVLGNVVKVFDEDSEEQCKWKPKLDPRFHNVSIVEFGAVGEGKALNIGAFQNVVFYLNSFVDKGRAPLYVLTRKWLTGSFNLTSHLTLS